MSVVAFGYSLVVLSALVLGCGRAERADTVPPTASDPIECPDSEESGAGKVAHEAYLVSHPDLSHAITIKLRDLSGTLPRCPESSDGSGPCPERDAALAKRQALNWKQVECVTKGFPPVAHWYELPSRQSSGFPAVIGTAFSTVALWSQVEALARHPYVERIEPAPGEAAKLGVAPPSIPGECPAATDSADVKLEAVQQIRGLGRHPVAIELREELLPAYSRSCSENDLCDDLVASGVERTIVSRRMRTCVTTFIESKLVAPAADVPYRQADAILDAPRFLPFFDQVHATVAFALGLTWEEASEIATHPYVDRLWASEGLTFAPVSDHCPPDYDSPVIPPECPLGREPSAGKFAPQDAPATWASSTAPHTVLVAIKRQKQLCPLPECPGDRTVGCPERERQIERDAEETRASQSCVRALIAAIGGTATDEVFVAGNGLQASVTWPQIQMVASHPHVVSITQTGLVMTPP